MTQEQDYALQHGHYFEDMQPGLTAVVSKTFSDADLSMYAGVSGDANPLHLSEEFARHTRLGGRVVHGMVTASLISTLVGTRLPGPGCLWMSQELRFLAPVRVGQTVLARATVTEVFADKQQARMQTTCEVGDTIVIDGHALVWVPRRSFED